MYALYEAIALVVLVSWLGFWEWRSALLMAISIPITLAMTFGALYLLRIDIQQVSVATLIIALGLLVDDPVLAGDSIKRTLAEGYPNVIAAWLGPTKLATAIMYATVTNIVAYLPFLMVTGSTGQFLHSLPIVMTVALMCRRMHPSILVTAAAHSSTVMETWSASIPSFIQPAVVVRGWDLRFLMDAPPAVDNLSDLISPHRDLIAPLGIFVIDRNAYPTQNGVRSTHGVIVAGILKEQPATLANLEVGDIISSANGNVISNIEELRKVFATFKPGDAVVLRVERQSVMIYVPFEME